MEMPLNSFFYVLKINHNNNPGKLSGKIWKNPGNQASKIRIKICFHCCSVFMAQIQYKKSYNSKIQPLY